jgi:hypothetical protein
MINTYNIYLLFCSTSLFDKFIQVTGNINYNNIAMIYYTLFCVIQITKFSLSHEKYDSTRFHNSQLSITIHTTTNKNEYNISSNTNRHAC